MTTARVCRPFVTRYRTELERNESVKPGSRLANATARLMVVLMFSTKNDIIFFGSGAASDFSILDASFFCE